MSQSTNILVIVCRIKCNHTVQNIYRLDAVTKITAGHRQRSHRANNGPVAAPLGLKIECLHTGATLKLVLPNTGVPLSLLPKWQQGGDI